MSPVLRRGREVTCCGRHVRACGCGRPGAVSLKLCAVFMACCGCGDAAATRFAAVGQESAYANSPTKTSEPIVFTAFAATTTTPRGAAPTDDRTTTSTTTTTTTTVGCSGVTLCLMHASCAKCLEAIQKTAGFTHTIAAYNNIDVAALRMYQVGFFQALQSSVSCSTSATPPQVLYPALYELDVVNSCDEAHGMVVGPCLLAEYACFVDSDCRQCLASLFTAAANHGSNGTKAAAFRSRACTATSPTLLNDMQNECGGQGSFPTCSSVKQSCTSLPECEVCLATFMAGNGAEAARQCHGATRPSALALQSVVDGCVVSNAAACDFWRQRCNDNADCGACLAGMGNQENLRAMAADWSTPACQTAMQNLFVMLYLNDIVTACPSITACRITVAECINHWGDQCLMCINGSALDPAQAAFCAGQQLQLFSFDTECQPCPASVHTINSVVFATVSVGAASAVACVAVAISIVAHGRDRASMRDSIVVGLMMANAVYSTANAIPLNALRTGVVDCGRLAMSFDAIRFGRAWWFCGKYGLVGFELFILAASIRALRSPMTPVPARAEAAMHLACCALGALAFTVFYALCARINADGYNTSTENEAFAGAYNHANSNDDLDDETPSVDASVAFQSGRDAYDNLVRDMLVAWDIIVGVAVLTWVVLRAVHQHALRVLRTKAVAAARAEAEDAWGDTRRSAWEAKRRLLGARRDAFNEVAKPLEPYIVVFVVFTVPAFVMSTPFCQEHSGAREVVSAGDAGVVDVATDFTYGMCDVWCEFVLAFRSLGTVAVYLVPRERRAELVGVRSTWRKLCSRALGCIRGNPSPYATLNHCHAGEYEMDALSHPIGNANHHSIDDSTVAMITTSATEDMSSWLINESNVTKDRQLGRGAFGGVWEGRLLPENHRVALKVLFAGILDEDGDVVDLNADEDFRRECEALQRVDSHYLIKFFGFGTTAEGNGFIVTELLGGGSLESALHDYEYDIPWRLRVTFGLHVALGMEHLHQLQMLHRDLKSANVLLDVRHTMAKVCDFGLARVVRPALRRVVQSPFTGVKRVVSGVDEGMSVIDDEKSVVLPLPRTAVSFIDARGTMTKAAGTLQWMAPEVFRGDRNYTNAVDVYSFGIVLWELATRKVPWVGELPLGDLELFKELNSALQSGRRPIVPDAVRAEHRSFVALMEQCWAGDPANRPPFSVAARDLVAILNVQCEYE